ncbi:MAG: hypothetical protein R2816_06025 [Flavobacteriaceae bacterium]
MEVTKLAFTICSNNYLAQAKTLADSLINYSPEYKIVVGLVDELSDEIDYNFFLPHEIVLAKDIGIENFESLFKKYNIIELNTCIKASFFKYIFERFKDLDFTYYFDPDLMFFDSLNKLDKKFTDFDILLTPHINTPIPLDDSYPHENLFLNYGIFNLGFIGLKRSKNSIKFLDWWEERTLNFGYINIKEGYFVDQLWINHVPLFFDKVKVLTDYGYNAAPWNLHERSNIKMKNEKYYMDDSSILTFFHFSAYNYKTPDVISKCYYRYSFDNCPDLKPLFLDYHKKLIQNNIEKISTISCYYIDKKENTPVQNNKLKKRFNLKLSTFLRELFIKIM